jgi:hypothetical protein
MVGSDSWWMNNVLLSNTYGATFDHADETE